MAKKANVLIYSSDFCPFCHRAKALLKQKGVSFKEIKVDFAPRKREEMKQKAGGRHTVPQIFISNEHVGGCDDLYDLERAGKLDPKLASA